MYPNVQGVRRTKKGAGAWSTANGRQLDRGSGLLEVPREPGGAACLEVWSTQLALPCDVSNREEGRRSPASWPPGRSLLASPARKWFKAER